MLNAKRYMEMVGVLDGRCQNHKVLDVTDFIQLQNPQVRTRKPKMENEGKRMKSMLLTEDVAKTDQHIKHEMICFISVSLGCCTAQWQDDDLIEAQEHCSIEHAISKPTKIDSVHGGSQFTETSKASESARSQRSNAGPKLQSGHNNRRKGQWPDGAK